MAAPRNRPIPVEQQLTSLEAHVRALDRVVDAASWTVHAKVMATGLGVLAATLILPWVRGGEDVLLERDQVVRGFELTPSELSPLPDDVAVLGAVAFWFLLVVTVPAVVYALRRGAAPAALAALAQTLLLGWFAWQAVVSRDEFDDRLGEPAIGLVVALGAVVWIAVVAFVKWVDDRRR